MGPIDGQSLNSSGVSRQPVQQPATSLISITTTTDCGTTRTTTTTLGDNHQQQQQPSQVQQQQQRKSSSSIHQAHSPGKILDWVHRLERLNASLSDEHQQKTTRLAPTESDKSGDPYEDDLCFKATQLITELLLMLFATALLFIVTIVIFSRKVPAFMASYEILPKLLFFLCVFISFWSFLGWLKSKFTRCIKRPTLCKLLHNENLMTQETNKVTTSRQLGHKNDLKDQQRQPLLAATKQNSESDLGQTNRLNQANAQQRFNVGVKTCPPLRQVAFDSSHIHLNEADEEEIVELADDDDDYVRNLSEHDSEKVGESGDSLTKSR